MTSLFMPFIPTSTILNTGVWMVPWRRGLVNVSVLSQTFLLKTVHFVRSTCQRQSAQLCFWRRRTYWPIQRMGFNSSGTAVLKPRTDPFVESRENGIMKQKLTSSRIFPWAGTIINPHWNRHTLRRSGFMIYSLKQWFSKRWSRIDRLARTGKRKRVSETVEKRVSSWK